MRAFKAIPDFFGFTYGVTAADPATDPIAGQIAGILGAIIPGVSQEASDEIVKALAGIFITVLSRVAFHFITKFKINGNEKESNQKEN